MSTADISPPTSPGKGFLQLGLILAAIAMTVLAIIPAYYELGPKLEATLHPVFAEIRAVGQDQTLPSSEFPLKFCAERGWSKPGMCEPTLPTVELIYDPAMETWFAWVLFKTDSLKDRQCGVRDASIRWLYDHQADAALVYFDDTDEQFKPGTATLAGPLISRPIRARIPRVAFSHNSTVLIWTFFYNCGKQWDVPAEFRIHIHFPAVDPTEKLPQVVAALE